MDIYETAEKLKIYDIIEMLIYKTEEVLEKDKEKLCKIKNLNEYLENNCDDYRKLCSEHERYNELYKHLLEFEF